MTDTIPNVPRELTIERDVFGAMHIKLGDFDFIQIQYQYPYTDNASTKALAERIAALLSAPSPAGVDDDYVPEGLAQAIMQSEEVDAVALAAKSLKDAGVDGLEVVGHIDSDDDVSGSYAVFKNDCDLRDGTELIRLPDAQTIIDGLRGEVAALREERDSFQRIGIRQIEHRYQLAELLHEKFPRIDPHHPITLSEVDHCCEYVLHKDRERLHCAIDAALSAGKDSVS